MRKQKGFSLIELLIVVAIILIIAAIAIPNLLRARMSANESSAAAGIRTISTAEVTYNTTYQNGYTNSMVALGTPAAGCTTPDATTGACLIDSVLTAATAATSPKNGYVFNVAFGSSSDKNTFVAGAYPAKFNSTGLRSFCATEDNVVHQNTAAQTAIPSGATCITAAWPALNN
jgi:type IV pilus assembly protein PilA